jgi:hypothetical protein
MAHPVESMTEDEWDLELSAQICDPVPGEHALDGHHDVIHVGLDQLGERPSFGGAVSVQDHRAALVDDAHVHAPCVQIDAAIVLVLSVVEAHGLLLTNVMFEDGRIPYLRGGGLNKYHIARTDRPGDRLRLRWSGRSFERAIFSGWLVNCRAS